MCLDAVNCFFLHIPEPLQVELTVASVPAERIVEMKCKANDAAQIKWLFNGSPLVENRQLKIRDMNFDGGERTKCSYEFMIYLHFLDSPAHWTINFFEISDGVYQCVAAGEHFFQSATKVLRVEKKRQQTSTSRTPTASALFPGLLSIFFLSSSHPLTILPS